MIEEIKTLWKDIEYKTGAIKDIACICGKKPNTVRTHWFSEANFWSIPESEQKTVKNILTNIIRKQNSKKQTA